MEPSEAVLANLLAFAERVRADPRVRALDEPDVVAQGTEIPHPMFNIVLGARFGQRARTRTAEVATRMMRRGVPFLWWVEDDPEVAAVLLELGLQPVPAVGMHRALDLPAPPPTTPGLTLEPVSAADPRFLDVMMEVFELPELVREPLVSSGPLLDPDAVHLVAHLDGRPVGTGSGVAGGGAWGLYNIATQAAVRGRGVGYDVVNALLAAGRERQLPAAVLQASTLGQRIYRRAGFAPVLGLTQYLWLPGSGS